MRKIMIMISVIVFAIACNDQAKDGVGSVSPTDTTAAADVSYPYTASYSSKFEIGDPKHSAAILGLWKDWDNGDLSVSRDRFADTIEMHFPDGSMIRNHKDSVTAISQKFRNTYASVTSTVDAWIPLKSTDKNENWVAIWGWEKHTDKAGKLDSVNLHEIWRFNPSGKIDFMIQFEAKAPPAKK